MGANEDIRLIPSTDASAGAGADADAEAKPVEESYTSEHSLIGQ